MTDELKEQAALFALGLLEETDRDEFPSAVAEDPELAALVDDYLATLAIVALSSETREPSSSLRARILAGVTGSDAAFSLEAIVPATGIPADGHQKLVEPVPTQSAIRTMPLSSAVPWLLAACLAIACGVLFFRLLDLQSENARMASETGFDALRMAVLDPQLDTLPGISAKVAWNSVSGSGMIETVSLPVQPSGKTYQLWVFEKDNPIPVSAGLFDPAGSPRAVFRPERKVENAAIFAVSIEVAGGRPQPEGPVVLAGELQKS